MALLQNAHCVKKATSSKSLEYHKTIPVAKISMKDIMHQNLKGTAENQQVKSGRNGKGNGSPSTVKNAAITSMSSAKNSVYMKTRNDEKEKYQT